jgi:hypothetical protein
MATLTRALFWQRVDTPGTDIAFVDDRRGLLARGVASAATPLPHVCSYELSTDESWATTRLEVTAEGAGWRRTARLERAAGRWRVTTAEQGDLAASLRAAGRAPVDLPATEEPARLAAALDVDLWAAPLFNTLPVRRLRLVTAAADTSHTLAVALVRVPSLEVMPVEQTYTALGAGKMRFSSGTFAADLEVDPDGYVVSYPGLAQLGG